MVKGSIGRIITHTEPQICIREMCLSVGMAMLMRMGSWMVGSGIIMKTKFLKPSKSF